ncbi:sulfatase-like hydrolase/transferase [Blastopirellula marina]|nr:sulfatase-like hydrolase/transferase [Blastopirellula marina]
MSPLPFSHCRALLAALLVAYSASLVTAAQPNIVLVIADDQGYGDLACHGNPVIQTPHIDRLASQASQLSNYHVAPTCSPTRAALQSGHWTDRTGAWHTIMGRSMLRANEQTLGQMLKANGYRTGMFGKWHLGDNYPYRPEDRGYDEVYRHGGGGVGQTPDVWDNAYFDGAYFHNGEIEAAEGFCTDVFFQQAKQFIRESAASKEPFFAYISTNAPHGPLHCPQEYMDKYADQKPAIAAFFGMITNIDDNVGQTRALLEELGIAENTMFIFTTDNGTATGASVYNAGMRGRKGSEYEGGHRVPFMCYWPAGGMDQQHVSDRLTHAVDVAPTLLDLIGGETPEDYKFDGISIRALLEPNTEVTWADRFLVTDSQRVRDPIKWKQTAVMSQDWRLINGKELYAIQKDPGQKHDVATKHPEQVAQMRAFYDQWWAELEPTFAETTEIYLGHPDAPEVTLTAHDWIQKGMPPWNQGAIRSAQGWMPQQKIARHEGHWAVKVIRDGTYQIHARRWPAEADHSLTSPLPPGENVPGASRAYRAVTGAALPITSATLRIDGKDLETLSVAEGDTEAVFTVELKKGSHRLAPIFTTTKGDELGAYYAVAKFLDESNEAAKTSRPNIIFVMADDMGWGQTGYRNHPVLKTPNLDNMAEHGLRFERFYAGCCVCSPTRASVLTGRSPDRCGVLSHGYALRHQEKTIAQALKEAGYVTGHFGKWHLNGLKGPGAPVLKEDTYGPGHFGFDEWLSVTNFYDQSPLMSRKGEFVQQEGDSSDVVVAEAIKFLKKHKDGAKPMFTVIWYGTPHSPFKALAKDKAPFAKLNEKSAEHYGELTAMDRSVGTLRTALREMDIADETLLVFCSDNGGLRGITPETVGGLRGFKGTVYEGGLRVPAIIEWPGQVDPRITNYPACTMDLFPTVADLLDLPKDIFVQPLDGVSLKPLLNEELAEREQPIPFRFQKKAAWVDNDYKLVHPNAKTFELYNLTMDPFEEHDLAKTQPKRFAQMKKAFLAWNEAADASFAGKDYPEGKLAEPDPEPEFWFADPRYKQYLPEWRDRWEFKSYIERVERNRKN